MSTETIEEIPPAEVADGNVDGSPARPAERRRVTFDISGSAVAKIVVGLLAFAFIGDLQPHKRLDNKYHVADHAKQHLDALPTVVLGAAGTVLGGAVAVSTVFLTSSCYTSYPASRG